MSKSLSTITRGIAALALSVAGLAVFASEAGALAAVTTAITVPGSVTTATVGVPITLTATQSNTADTGAVSFQVNYNSAGAAAISTACTSVAVTAGVATCSWTPTTAGTAVVTAVAAADATYAVSTGGTYSFTVSTIAAPTASASGASDATGSGTIKFAWTNPSQTLGITGYSVVDGASFSAGTVLCSVSGSGIAGAANTCSYTGTGVAAGDTVKVYSTNGSSAAAAAATTAYTLAAPSTATLTSATAGNGTITFVFDETANANDALQPTKAVVKTVSGSVVCTTTSATTCTTTASAAGLSTSTGSSVGFYLYIYNAVGSTVATPSDGSISAIPANAPGAFTATAAVSYATGYVTVSWTAATGGLGTPTYTVKDAASHTFTCTTITATSCKIAISATSGNLLSHTSPFNGVLTVVATNSQGGQYATANTASIFVSAQPGAATQTSAPTYSAGAMTIAFTGLASETGISGYTLQLQSCTGATSTTCTASGSPVFIAAAGNTHAYSYTGFTASQGSTYSYSVQAVTISNVYGPALQGSVVKYAISAPGDVTISAAQAIANPASATNSSFTATWTAPTSTGGSPIVGYDLVLISQCSSSSCSAGVAGTAVTAAATSTATSYTFTNLPAGFYGFKVKAINTATGVTGTGESTNWVTSAGAISVGNGGAALGAPTVTYPSATTVKFSVASLSGASTFKIANVGTSATVCTLTVVSGTGTCTVDGSALGWTSTNNSFAAYSTDAAGLSSLIGSATAIAAPNPTISATNSYTGTNGQTLKWTASSATNVYGFNIIATNTTTGKTVTATKATADCTGGCTYLFPTGVLSSTDSYTFQLSAFNPVAAQAFSASPIATTGAANAAAVPTTLAVATTAATDVASGSTATVTWVAGSAEATNATTTYTVTATSQATSSGSYAGGVVTTVVVPATSRTATLTGLLSGVSYKYSVVANGYLSDSTAVSTSTAVANPVQPSAPTGVTVVAKGDNSKLTVTWTTPTNTGGAALWGYIVSVSPAITGANYSNSTCISGGTGGQAAVFAKGLATAGNTCYFGGTIVAKTKYTVSVTAYNAGAGNLAVGWLSADLALNLASSAANGTSPGAPANNHAALATMIATCNTYHAPLNIATSVTSAADIAACAGGLLTSGNFYALATYTNPYVTAALALGYTSVAGTGSVTTGTDPGVPTQVTASVATGNVVTVSWTAPALNGGSAITGYKVTASTGTISSAVACTVPGTTDTVARTSATVATITGTSTSVTCVITDSNASITYQVQAINGASNAANSGLSDFSIKSSAIATVQKPAAPTYPVVANVSPTTSTGNGGIYVAWTASDVLSNDAATSYVVTIDAGTANAVSVTTTNTYYAFPAVSNATVHSIIVSAVNAAGSTAAAAIYNAAGLGLASAPSNPTLIVSKQDTTSTLTPGYTLSWTAGNSVTGLVGGVGGSNTTTVLPSTYRVVGISALNAVITDQTTSATTLTLPYVAGETFTVYQITAGGTSTGTTGTVYTNGAVPGKPSFTSVATSAYSQTTGTETVTLTCAASGTTGLAGTVTTTATVNGVTKACASGAAFTGLAPNTAYSYSIVSTNVVGTSTATTGSFTSDPQVPGSPTTVTSVNSVDQTTGEQYVTVSWTAPALNGGSAVTGYTVAWGTNAQGAGGGTCSAVLTDSSTSCKIDLGVTTATTGNNYATVTAYNMVGSGSAANSQGSSYGSATYDTNTLGSTVAQTTISSVLSTGLGSLAITWADTNISGIVVTGYIAKATGTDGTSATCTGAAATTTCTITGLTNQAYSIVVTPQTATQAFGTAAASAANTSWTGWIAPNVAAQILGGASQVGGTASVLFNAMSVTAGAANSLPATSYQATAYTADGKVAGTATCTASPCTVTGLANATTYTITVVPTNAVGAGSASSSVTVATLSSANPAAPTGVAAVRTANGLSVSWTAPATLGSAAQLVGYWVSATDTLTGQQNTCPYNATYGVLLAPSVSCNITGLTVGNNYTVSVTAIGIDGAMNKLLSAAATASVVYNTLAPTPVIATFLAVTAKQKSVSALSGPAKSALNNLISVTNDGAKITVYGYGTTKAIALARANAAANYLFNNGAAVHVSIKTVISRTIKTALVTVTSN